MAAECELASTTTRVLIINETLREYAVWSSASCHGVVPLYPESWDPTDGGDVIVAWDAAIAREPIAYLRVPMETAMSTGTGVPFLINDDVGQYAPLDNGSVIVDAPGHWRPGASLRVSAEVPSTDHAPTL